MVDKESDYFLLCSDEWLKVCLFGVVGSPDGDVVDEVWEYVLVVELDHGFCWEEFVDVFECLHGWLEFFDYVVDCLSVFEVVLYSDAE